LFIITIDHSDLSQRNPKTGFVVQTKKESLRNVSQHVACIRQFIQHAADNRKQSRKNDRQSHTVVTCGYVQPEHRIKEQKGKKEVICINDLGSETKID